jgi:hypothetical protein
VPLKAPLVRSVLLLVLDKTVARLMSQQVRARAWVVPSALRQVHPTRLVVH